LFRYRADEQVYYYVPLLLYYYYTRLTSSFPSRTTWVSRYQKGKPSLDLNEARDDGVQGWQWHQLDHMRTICTTLQTDNRTSTSSLIFTGILCTCRKTRNNSVLMHCVLQNTLRVETDNSAKLQHFAAKIASHNTGVDKGCPGGPAPPPNCRAEKIFWLK